MTAGIERIVVALDAASENRTAIGTAARLAARWKAHLHGIFIEDDDLIRLAALPFARQVTLGFGVEPLNLQRAERQMHAFAERARLDLAAAAKHHGVEWSFETVRGSAAERIGEGSDRDFLVCGTTTRPIGGHFRVECRWWSAMEPGSTSVLLAHRDWSGEGLVAALLQDRKPASERLLEATARLAEAHGGRLAVICAPELTKTPGFKAWLDKCLADQPVKIELNLAPSEPAALIRRIVELDCRVVALASGVPGAQPERLRDMVAKIACDVLVVR
jgi:nucleotide-binding universal stress UspA family protein